MGMQNLTIEKIKYLNCHIFSFCGLVLNSMPDSEHKDAIAQTIPIQASGFPAATWMRRFQTAYRSHDCKEMQNLFIVAVAEKEQRQHHHQEDVTNEEEQQKQESKFQQPFRFQLFLPNASIFLDTNDWVQPVMFWNTIILDLTYHNYTCLLECVLQHVFHFLPSDLASKLVNTPSKHKHYFGHLPLHLACKSPCSVASIRALLSLGSANPSIFLRDANDVKTINAWDLVAANKSILPVSEIVSFLHSKNGGEGCDQGCLRCMETACMEHNFDVFLFVHQHYIESHSRGSCQILKQHYENCIYFVVNNVNETHIRETDTVTAEEIEQEGGGLFFFERTFLSVLSLFLRHLFDLYSSTCRSLAYMEGKEMMSSDAGRLYFEYLLQKAASKKNAFALLVLFCIIQPHLQSRQRFLHDSSNSTDSDNCNISLGLTYLEPFLEQPRLATVFVKHILDISILRDADGANEVLEQRRVFLYMALEKGNFAIIRQLLDKWQIQQSPFFVRFFFDMAAVQTIDTCQIRDFFEIQKQYWRFILQSENDVQDERTFAIRILRHATCSVQHTSSSSPSLSFLFEAFNMFRVFMEKRGGLFADIAGRLSMFALLIKTNCRQPPMTAAPMTAAAAASASTTASTTASKSATDAARLALTTKQIPAPIQRRPRWIVPKSPLPPIPQRNGRQPASSETLLLELTSFLDSELGELRSVILPRLIQQRSWVVLDVLMREYPALWAYAQYLITAICAQEKGQGPRPSLEVYRLLSSACQHTIPTHAHILAISHLFPAFSQFLNMAASKWKELQGPFHSRCPFEHFFDTWLSASSVSSAQEKPSALQCIPTFFFKARTRTEYFVDMHKLEMDHLLLFTEDNRIGKSDIATIWLSKFVTTRFFFAFARHVLRSYRYAWQRRDGQFLVEQSACFLENTIFPSLVILKQFYTQLNQSPLKLPSRLNPSRLFLRQGTDREEEEEAEEEEEEEIMEESVDEEEGREGEEGDDVFLYASQRFVRTRDGAAGNLSSSLKSVFDAVFSVLGQHYSDSKTLETEISKHVVISRNERESEWSRAVSLLILISFVCEDLNMHWNQQKGIFDGVCTYACSVFKARQRKLARAKHPRVVVIRDSRDDTDRNEASVFFSSLSSFSVLSRIWKNLMHSFSVFPNLSLYNNLQCWHMVSSFQPRGIFTKWVAFLRDILRVRIWEDVLCARNDGEYLSGYLANNLQLYLEYALQREIAAETRQTASPMQKHGLEMSVVAAIEMALVGNDDESASDDEQRVANDGISSSDFVHFIFYPPRSFSSMLLLRLVKAVNASFAPLVQHTIQEGGRFSLIYKCLFRVLERYQNDHIALTTSSSFDIMDSLMLPENYRLHTTANKDNVQTIFYMGVRNLFGLVCACKPDSCYRLCCADLDDYDFCLRLQNTAMTMEFMREIPPPLSLSAARFLTLSSPASRFHAYQVELFFHHFRLFLNVMPLCKQVIGYAVAQLVSRIIEAHAFAKQYSSFDSCSCCPSNLSDDIMNFVANNNTIKEIITNCLVVFSRLEKDETVKDEFLYNAKQLLEFTIQPEEIVDGTFQYEQEDERERACLFPKTRMQGILVPYLTILKHCKEVDYANIFAISDIPGIGSARQCNFLVSPHLCRVRVRLEPCGRVVVVQLHQYQLLRTLLETTPNGEIGGAEILKFCENYSISQDLFWKLCLGLEVQELIVIRPNSVVAFFSPTQQTSCCSSATAAPATTFSKPQTNIFADSIARDSLHSCTTHVLTTTFPIVSSMIPLSSETEKKTAEPKKDEQLERRSLGQHAVQAHIAAILKDRHRTGQPPVSCTDLRQLLHERLFLAYTTGTDKDVQRIEESVFHDSIKYLLRCAIMEEDAETKTVFYSP